MTPKIDGTEGWQKNDTFKATYMKKSEKRHKNKRNNAKECQQRAIK